MGRRGEKHWGKWWQIGDDLMIHPLCGQVLLLLLIGRYKGYLINEVNNKKIKIHICGRDKEEQRDSHCDDRYMNAW